MKKVLIVGGGYCGTMLAHHLRDADIEVTLVERSQRAAAGPPYGSCAPGMLLNVPAGRMGAIPEAEDEFVTWSRDRGLDFDSEQYVERQHYAAYLKQFVPGLSARFRVLYEEVVESQSAGGGFIATLSSGETLRANALVLACGNLAKQDYFGADLSSPRVFGDPWEDGGWRNSDARMVLISGASLTAVDVALHFLDRSETKIRIISRRGKLPLARGEGMTAQSLPEDAFNIGKTRELQAFFRHWAASSSNWRNVFEGIRFQLPRLWQSLSTKEQRRFLRHAATYWNIHRHRLPNESSAKLEDAQKSGRLAVLAGRILEAKTAGTGVELALRKAHDQTVWSLHGDVLINCLGPADSPEQTRSPLFHQLLRSKLIQTHPSGVGLAVESNGYRVLQPGKTVLPLFTIGHRSAVIGGESTAVPQLRLQAKELAEILRDAG